MKRREFKNNSQLGYVDEVMCDSVGGENIFQKRKTKKIKSNAHIFLEVQGGFKLFSIWS